MARSGVAAAFVGIVLCGCLGSGGGPPFTGDGTISARIEDPTGSVLATADDAAALCTGSEPRAALSVSGDRIAEIEGRGLFLTIGLEGPNRGGAPSSAMVIVTVDGVQPVEVGGVLPSWQMTSRSTVEITQEDGLSGSAVFGDLEFGPGEPPATDRGPLPERISGSARWTCDELEEPES